MEQATERIESLKAGLAGGLAAAGAFAAITGSLIWFSTHSAPALVDLTLVPTLRVIIWQAGVALLSGFLFGLTYRYVIRGDRNSHLQSGAVLAFGLVRGLAPLQDFNFSALTLWQTGLQIASSLLLFGAAALLIDQLMARGWIKRF